MTARYICKKIITATEAANDKGEPGYKVIYEDGYTSWSPKAVFEAGYELIGNTGHLPGYHERLLAEGTLLCNNLERLTDWLEGGGHLGLTQEHKHLLRTQQTLMTQLLHTLTERAELLK
ncbi:MAG: hypothetical protein [Bacteriophage sp.]|nr:MAG: hypothetical protein [Bacteriophage sp.]